MSTIQDTDYLLINRGGIDYKVKIDDLKNYLDSLLPPEVQPPDTGISVGDWGFNFSTSKPISMSSDTCLSKDLNPFKNWGTYGITFNSTNNQMKFYHNGNLAGTDTLRSTPSNPDNNDLTLFALDPNNGSWRCGYRGWARSYRLYNKVLTESELKSNYSQDMDFGAPYQQPNTPGAIVVLDARKSNINIDLTKNHAYVENLVNGSMNEFWWTDGGTGISNNGNSNPSKYLERDLQYGIWKFNESRTYNHGYISSRYKPNLGTSWTMEFSLVPLSMGYQNSTYLASCPRSSASSLKLLFAYNNCSPVEYP